MAWTARQAVEWAMLDHPVATCCLDPLKSIVGKSSASMKGQTALSRGYDTSGRLLMPRGYFRWSRNGSAIAVVAVTSKTCLASNRLLSACDPGHDPIPRLGFFLHVFVRLEEVVRGIH